MNRNATAARTLADSRRVERVYGTMAGVYDACFDWALGPGRRQAVERLPIREGDHVLEVGVGTGLSLPLYPSHCQVTGVDISEPMLEVARRRLASVGRGRNVELAQMDARRLDLPDASVDHVMAPYVISVVPDPAVVMAEIARVCRPGGTVTVVNRFRDGNPLLARAENLLTPLTQWVGFRLDLDLSVVTGTHGLTVESVEPVNLMRMWRVVHLLRTDEGSRLPVRPLPAVV